MASSAPLARRNLQSPSTNSINQNYRMNGKIIISALVILFFIVFIILLLHIYTKRLRRSAASGLQNHLQRSSVLSQADAPLPNGLDKEVVEALPTFRYKSPCLCKGTRGPEAALVCVVCLSEFRHDETCKLLPKCKHFFHINCIDMWLISNTTCPLCRAAADPSDSGELHDAAGSASCCFANQDGGNELKEQYQRAAMPTLGTRDNIPCGISSDDREGQTETLLRGHFSVQSPTTSLSYRRSKSEKFSHGTQGTAALATNILTVGNHTLTTTRTNGACWQTGGRSFSHIPVDILKPEESLVAVSSCPTLSKSPELCSTEAHLVHSPAANSSH